MNLAELAATSKRIAGTRSRNEKTAELASLFRKLEPREVEAAVAFLCAQPRQGKIGLGGAAIRELPAEGAAETPTLTLADVDEAFARIAGLQGPGSASRRQEVLAELFARATEEERAFLRGLVFGELRQGALEGLLMDAVAQAANVPTEEIRRASMLAGDFGNVAAAALASGRAGLEPFQLAVFRPVLPMLAESASDIAGALASLGRAGLELKIDGARIQAHKSGSDVRIYSRSLHDVTDRVPEVADAVRAMSARELILDGEVAALRPDGRPRAFQETLRRFGRKLDVEAARKDLPLSVFLFDCMLVDGTPAIDWAAERRFAALATVAPADQVITRIVTDSPQEGEEFLRGAVSLGHEGIVLKSLTAPYEAGRRGSSWLKLKVARTLDLVVLAAEWGSGRRRGWLSNLHLGARDPVTGGFVMVGKTFKGLTDEMLAWQTRRFLELEAGREGHVVLLRPEQVVEVAFNEVQASPRYPGGIALRFARVRGYRHDKSAREADTIDAVRAYLAGD